VTARRAIRSLGLPIAALLAAPIGVAAVAPPARAEATGPLVVFAAASLTDAFRALETPFRAAHPGLALRFSFAASSTLAVQIREGAPADVVATADQHTMQALVDAGRVGDPRLFARNRLAIVVEAGDPKHVMGLADLARPDLLVVLAAPEVPAGRYARMAFDRAGLSVAPRSLEANVRGVLTKVALGEADAGIVYASDVRTAGDRVQAVPFAEADALPVTYWVAPVREAADASAARAWVDFLSSRAARRALVEAGFQPPSDVAP
jgi:molybdate transport system substrate-binding protein